MSAMANIEEEWVIDFGHVTQWLPHSQQVNLIAHKVVAAASITLNDTVIPSDDGATSHTFDDPFDLDS
jgi:hypothetical protein